MKLDNSVFGNPILIPLDATFVDAMVRGEQARGRKHARQLIQDGVVFVSPNDDVVAFAAWPQLLEDRPVDTARVFAIKIGKNGYKFRTYIMER